MARRLGSCRISLPPEVASGVASRWTAANGGLEVSVTTAGIEEHDVAMELVLCLGQALWERLSDGQLREYWLVLDQEIRAGISGEIDEQALEEKRSLFESRSHANNVKRLTGYGRASFTGTVAEYVHCLWHEVKLLLLFLGRVLLPDTGSPQGLHSSCSACQSPALPYRFQ